MRPLEGRPLSTLEDRWSSGRDGGGGQGGGPSAQDPWITGRGRGSEPQMCPHPPHRVGSLFRDGPGLHAHCHAPFPLPTPLARLLVHAPSPSSVCPVWWTVPSTKPPPVLGLCWVRPLSHIWTPLFPDSVPSEVRAIGSSPEKRPRLRKLEARLRDTASDGQSRDIADRPASASAAVCPHS